MASGVLCAVGKSPRILARYSQKQARSLAHPAPCRQPDDGGFPMSAIKSLRDLIGRHATGRLAPTAVPGLTLFRSESRSVPLNCLYRSRLYLVVQGRKRVELGRHSFIYDDSHYLLTTVDLPVSSAVIEAAPDRPYLALSIDFDQAVLAELLLSLPMNKDTRVEQEAGLAVAALDEALLDSVRRLVALLDTPGDIPVLAPLVRQEIYYRLLTGPLGARLRAIAVADSHMTRIARVMAWMRAHYAEDFGIDALARLAGMSAPSLFRHFKAVALMSPMQYRTCIRLQEARRRLVADGRDAAEAGFAVGYDSPSQFSRDYRRMFGAPPAHDAARLRRDSLLLVQAATEDMERI